MPNENMYDTDWGGGEAAHNLAHKTYALLPNSVSQIPNPMPE